MLNRDNITDLTILIYVGIRSIELNLQRYTDPISYTHTNFMATLHDTRFGSGKHRLLTKKQACTNDSLLNQDSWHRYHYWINRQSSRISWIFCKRLVPLFARDNTCSSAGRSSDDFGRASDSRWITSCDIVDSPRTRSIMRTTRKPEQSKQLCDSCTCIPAK